jgi:hypothetical protein
MIETVEGVIDNIYSKDVNTRFGQKPVYHAMIDGLDINLGFKCEFEEGEYVTLQVQNGKYGYELAKGNGSAGPSKGPGRGTSVASNQQRPANPAPRKQVSAFPVPKGTKDISIIRQNSGNHASRIVAALINQGKIEDAETALDTFMDLAYAITDFGTGHREEKIAAQQAAQE